MVEGSRTVLDIRRMMRCRVRIVPITLAVAGIIGLGFSMIAGPEPVVVWNGTPSVDKGFYLIRTGPLRKGDLVLARLPPSVRRFVRNSGYLPVNVPVLKYVSAASGDAICRNGTVVTLNGKRIAVALSRDGNGRKLPIWRGCLVLRDEEMFLLTRHPRSFDGRYWGLVDRNMIIGRAFPL